MPTMEMHTLTRSRSSTAPSRQPHPPFASSALPPGSAADSTSTFTPVDPKPRLAHTLPNPTSDSQVHIPATSGLLGHDREHRHSSKHHHTRSDAHRSGFRSHRRDRSEALPHLTAGIAAERARRVERRAEQAKLPNEPWGARTNDDLRPTASNQSHPAGAGVGRGIQDGPSRRRAISDPKSRLQQTARSEVEILLDRAEARKRANRAAVTQKDVDKIRKINEEAEEELQRRLAAVNMTCVEITRRLDYTYYSVLEKVGNLVAIVQSFHSLSSQTRDLIDNLTAEASALEKDVTTKVETFKTSFDERYVRVKQLEERGARANAKAQELGQRLENARERVEAWERKQVAERRRRHWFWRSVWTAFIALVVIVFFGLTWREWQSEVAVMKTTPMGGDNGKLGHLNQSLLLEKGAAGPMEVPADLKSTLSGTAEKTSGFARKRSTSQATTAIVDRPIEDERLRHLDEL